MLDYYSCLLTADSGIELKKQVQRCLRVENIVIRDFFSLKLFEHFVEFSEKHTTLMWIFAVTKRFCIILSQTEMRFLISIKIIKYC